MRQLNTVKPLFIRHGALFFKVSTIIVVFYARIRDDTQLDGGAVFFRPIEYQKNENGHL